MKRLYRRYHELQYRLSRLSDEALFNLALDLMLMTVIFLAFWWAVLP